MNTINETELKMMLQFANKLKELEWTDAEELNLPEKYTDLMVHIALEKADADKDNKNYKQILYGNGPYRTLMLEKHIEKTIGVFEWNYRVRCEGCDKSITKKDLDYIERMENVGLADCRSCDCCEKCFISMASNQLAEGGDNDWNLAFEVCNPPCVKRSMIGRSWWKCYGFNSPCGCAHLAEYNFNEKEKIATEGLKNLKMPTTEDINKIKKIVGDVDCIAFGL